MREQQGWEENLQEFRREYPPFLHDTGVPHAERGCAPGVFEEEFPGFGEEMGSVCSGLEKEKLHGAHLTQQLCQHSLGWDVLGPAGPIPDPICVLPQQPLHLPPPFQEILLRLKPRATIRQRLEPGQLGAARAPALQPGPLPRPALTLTFPPFPMPLPWKCSHPRSRWGAGRSIFRAGCEWQRPYPISHIPYPICAYNETALAVKSQSPAFNPHAQTENIPSSQL